MKASDLVKDIGRIGFYTQAPLQFLVTIEEVVVLPKEDCIRYLIKPVSGKGEMLILSTALTFPKELENQ